MHSCNNRREKFYIEGRMSRENEKTSESEGKKFCNKKKDEYLIWRRRASTTGKKKKTKKLAKQKKRKL